MSLHVKKIPNPGLKELPDKQIIPEVITQTWAEQAEIVEQAQRELRKIQHSIESLKSEAYREGHAQGYEDGKVDGLSFIKQSAVTYESARNNLWREVIDLVEQCVKKVVGELDVKTRIARMVEQSLDAKKDKDATVLKVSPELGSQIGATVRYKQASEEQVLHVVIDANLEGERCIVVCPRHIVECNIDTQIANLKRTLLAFPPKFEEQILEPEVQEEPEVIFEDTDEELELDDTLEDTDEGLELDDTLEDTDEGLELDGGFENMDADLELDDIFEDSDEDLDAMGSETQETTSNNKKRSVFDDDEPIGMLE